MPQMMWVGEGDGESLVCDPFLDFTNGLFSSTSIVGKPLFPSKLLCLHNKHVLTKSSRGRELKSSRIHLDGTHQEKKKKDFIGFIKCQVLTAIFQRLKISHFPLVVDMESRPACLCCRGSCVGGVQDGATSGFDNKFWL